jgi:hypothetical protein
VKERFLLSLAEANACVGNGKYKLCFFNGFFLEFDRELDRAGVGKFNTVLQEVQDDLA